MQKRNTTTQKQFVFRLSFSIPLGIIQRNSGIPLGILALLLESTSLYSMVFEYLKELDKKKPNHKFLYLQKLACKKYLTDEHKSFTKLGLKYNLQIFNCYVHLIRTIGSNSLLGYFLSDLLYTYSETQWDNNYIRMFYTFQSLFKERNPNSDTTRFDKVAQVLGQDPEGNAVETKDSYCPIYKRAEDHIPSCTNHIESLHMRINQLTKGSKGLPLRLAIICKYIIDRTQRVNTSIQDNLKGYLNNLKKKAEISQKPKCDKCDCGKKFYYTQLFGIEVPCIHDICSKFFNEKILLGTIQL